MVNPVLNPGLAAWFMKQGTGQNARAAGGPGMLPGTSDTKPRANQFPRFG